MAGPYKTKSGGGTIGLGTYRGEHVVSSTWAVGDRVVPTRAYAPAAAKGFVYECTTAGTGGASQPTWVFTTPDISTTTDGGATFTCRDCTTWPNASVYADYLVNNRLTAGETLYIASTSAEVVAASYSINGPGTVINPIKILSVSDASETPSSVTPGASIATTIAGTSAFSIGGIAFIHGISFLPGNEGSLNAHFNINETINARDCKIILGSNSSSSINLNASNSVDNTWIRFSNLQLDFGQSAQEIILSGGLFEFIGLSLISGSVSPASLFEAQNTSGENSVLNVAGLDLSNAGAGIDLIEGSTGLSTGCCVQAQFFVSKLPDSWTGDLVNGNLYPGARIAMYCSDSADTNYRTWIRTYAGSIKTETTLVMTGGATDNGQAISWAMASNANANEALNALMTDWIALENTTTGAAKTLTVEILHDSLTNLTDAEIMLEAIVMTTSGRPLGTRHHDGRADILATPADQSASTAAWTTTGMTNPNKQKLSVTVTPQEAGLMYCRVHLMIPSKTVYVDPKVTVT